MKREGSKYTQIAPPQMIKGNSANDLFAWVYGIGTYASTTQITHLKSSGNKENLKFTLSPYNDLGREENVYTDLLGISQAEVAKKIKAGDFGALDAGLYYLKSGFYDSWNFVTMGFVGRHGELIKKYEKGEISESTFYQATTIDALGSVAAVAAVAVGARIGLAAEAR